MENVIEKRDRIPELDGIRSIAILMVMAWHYLAHPLAYAETLFTPLGRFLWSGVDLFFVLSGFLISGILYDSLHSSRYYRNFYIRRALRILPPYLVLLSLYVIAQCLIPEFFLTESGSVLQNRYSIWWYFFYLQNIPMWQSCDFGGRWLGLTWSLAIEEQFYCLFPWIVKHSAKAKVPVILLLFCGIALCLRTLQLMWGVDWQGILVFFPGRIDAFALGALGAWIYRSPSALQGLRRHSSLLQLLAFLVIIFSFFALYRPVYPGEPLVATFGLSWIAFTYFFLILGSVALIPREHWFRRSLRIPFFSQVARVSYAMYLFHEIIYVAIQLIVPDLPSRAGTIFLRAIVAAATTYAVAELSWALLEKKCMRLRSQFPS